MAIVALLILPNDQILALPHLFDVSYQAQAAFSPGSAAQEFWCAFVHVLPLTGAMLLGRLITFVEIDRCALHSITPLLMIRILLDLFYQVDKESTLFRVCFRQCPYLVPPGFDFEIEFINPRFHKVSFF